MGKTKNIGDFMKERLIDILKQNYGENYFELRTVFGLPVSIHYNALIVSPVWNPADVFSNESYKIQEVSQHKMISSYIVEYLGKKVAWIKCVPGSCNLIDVLGMSASLVFDKMIFVGAVGSLSRNTPIGEICTPEVCVSGCMSEAYLLEDPLLWKPFQIVMPNDKAFVDRVCCIRGGFIKKSKVFCTDSIFCERSHLGFFARYKAEYVEMETSTFYRIAELFEIPSVALLIVSDNLMTGNPLVGTNSIQEIEYKKSYQVLLPDLLGKILQL